MRAWLNLRYTTDNRARIFEKGLQAHGFKTIHKHSTDPVKGDIFVTWNRIGKGNHIAKMFEKKGCLVLVVENAIWGNEFAGDKWYSIAQNHHNTAGLFPVGDKSRWDDLRVDLSPFRTGGETIILPQRGRGTPPTAMPARWAERAMVRHNGRIRKHPGQRISTPLHDDLKNCGKVVTWGSGAAIKALMMGIPVISEMPDWIGKQDNTEEGRLQMFRRLAWAQWRLSEIESGEAFVGLLDAQ